ncbi:MAG: FAD-dependent oxidoreductase [Bacillota bacterium]
MQVVVVGGGWAGCAAAWAARAAGAKVALLEKTDLLLGTGLVGGIMYNNGRQTAACEIRALGGGKFLDLIDQVARHRNVNFPGHDHAMLYDVTRIEPVIRTALYEAGVDIRLQIRVVDVNREGNRIKSIVSAAGEIFNGDVFIDTTGTAGPQKNCTRYGTGCAMCILRCPSFGPRVSLVARAGVEEIKAGEEFPHIEAMSGSCKLDKGSLDPSLVARLEREGFLVIPLPKELYKDEMLGGKACQQYAIEEYARNMIILDTGHAKLMTSYFPLETLRSMPGFARARFADPYSGGTGNSIRFMAMAPCGDDLSVSGVENLFCAGEKTGPLVGHTEAIATGMLAGHNAARRASGRQTLVLPADLAAGDIISYMHREMKNRAGLQKKYTFSGSVYFDRMKYLGLYTTDRQAVEKRVAATGLQGVFNRIAGAS